MQMLDSLVYVSTAVESITDDSLSHLLERAQDRNRRCHITGVLLFDSGNFMQYIEGPANGLEEIYGQIVRDPLHSGIIQLCHEHPTARFFSDWAMGIRVVNCPALSEGRWKNDPFEARLGLVPESASAAVALLRGFWNRSQQRRWQ